MFDVNELASLDSKYFTVIYKDIYDITIKSNNTGHYGACTVQAIRSSEQLSYFIRILRPARIISTEGQGV